MPETRRNRAQSWLIGSIVLNLAASISGLVSSRTGDAAWLATLRIVALAFALVCLVMFFIRWRQYRAAEEADAEHTRQ